jgi:glycosyltransferase involved in cell wall biosynthesis
LDLSVIVPTYRCAERIYTNMCRLSAALDEMPYRHEILVVSDGNTDGTDREIRRLSGDCPNLHALHYGRNQGKGYALTYGVARSRGRLITFIDGDGDIDPKQITTYVELMERERADIVVGSKRHPDSQVVYPLPRRLYSWGYQALLQVLFNLQVRDTQVGLKVFRRQVLEAVLPRIVVKRYAFDLELLVVARHLGYCRIVEAPVTIGERFTSTIGLRAVRNVLHDTLAIFYRKHILHYYDTCPQVELQRVPLLLAEQRPSRLGAVLRLSR